MPKPSFFSKITTYCLGLTKWCHRPRPHRRLWRQRAQVDRAATPLTPEVRNSPYKARLVSNEPTTRNSLAPNTAEETLTPFPQPTPTQSRPFLDLSSRISDAKGLQERYFWPAKPSFMGRIKEPDGKPAYGGGYSDVWQCQIRFSTPSETLPTKVAVKVLRSVWMNNRSATEANEQLLRRFQQEAITWVGLPDHPNIVPLIGWTLTPNLSFISPWYEKGNLYGHLKSLSWSQQLHVLFGIAKGLDYLHSCSPPIVHGDLKPENILFSDWGEPLLADFGLSTVLGEEEMYTFSHRIGGSMPWMAPECMLGGPRSCESDIYSFGSLIFTVQTGELPHAGLTDGQITLRVCNSSNPKDPVEDWNKYPQLQGSVGDLLRDCWLRSPQARPTMSAVVARLTVLLESLES